MQEDKQRWIKYKTTDDDEYYFNELTDETTWELPQDAVIVSYEDLISVEVADNCEIRDILHALIDTLCCTNNAQAAQVVISIEKSSECPLCEDKLSGSELEQITPEKNTEESSGIIVLETETDKVEDNISCHSDEMRNEPISNNQNKVDDVVVVDVCSEIGHLREKSCLDIVSKNPFDDGDNASSHSPSALCTTGNPFDDTSISPNPPIAIKAKAKSFIIRSQPPQANAIPTNVGQQRYKPTTATTSTGSKSAKIIDAPSYPKTLFAARPEKVEIPSSSTSSSSSRSPSMSSSSHRPSVSVAASSPLRRTSIAFVAPAESIPEVSPTVLTLMRMGVNRKVATAALQTAQDDLQNAANSIHDEMISAVNKDPYSSHLNLWKPPISLRIKSWLPNFTYEGNDKDYFTGYVISVNFTDADDSLRSWQVTHRFQRFKDLQSKIVRYGSHVPVRAPFPMDTAAMKIFGVNDSVRNDRMNALDKWLREVILNLCLMTLLPLNRAVYEFLQVEQNLGGIPSSGRSVGSTYINNRRSSVT